MYLATRCATFQTRIGSCTSLPPAVDGRDPAPAPRRRSCVPSWGAASHWWSCRPRSSTAWRGRARASHRISRSIFRGAIRASPRGTTPSRRCAEPVRCGETRTLCGRVSRAWGPGVPTRCCWHAPRWGRSRGSRARPSAAWCPFMVTEGSCAVGGRAGAGARLCAPCCTWARAWRLVSTRSSKPCITGFSRPGRSKKSP